MSTSIAIELDRACAAAISATVRLPVSYHDFKKGVKGDGYHPDFQMRLPSRRGVVKGLVQPSLGKDRLPVFSGLEFKNGAKPSKPVITSVQSFEDWFHTNASVNRFVPGSLTFYHQNSTKLWTTTALRFHPLTGKGWNDRMHGRNFLFTMEMHIDIQCVLRCHSPL